VGYQIVGKKMSLNMLKSLREKERGRLKYLPFNGKVVAPFTLIQMFDYANKDKNEGFRSLPIGRLIPIAPIRSKPRKTYDDPGIFESPEGDHIPYELRKALKAGTDVSKKINGFGFQSGMFKKFDVKDYGKTDDTLFRMNFILNKKPINIVNLGYGVSQVLPILYSMYMQNTAIITIQQPEVHLHPKAQAALGDTFFDSSLGKKGKKLVIETHSDYIIDRFRQRQRKSTEKVSVHTLFFMRNKGINMVFPIKIDHNGNYDADQPAEFREFFIKEVLENLGLQP
jgi:hypothetical protein